MKTLITRALTGIIFVALMVAGIYLHPYTLAALFALICAVSVHEYIGLVAAFDVEKRPETTASMTLLLVLAMVLYGIIAAIGLQWLPTAYWVLLLPLLLLVFLKELYNAQSKQPFVRAALHIAGLVYLVLPLGMTVWLANPDGRFAPHRIMGILILVWANDTFAYLTGFALGRRPLFTRISPKKTWEGSIGGAIGTLSLAYVLPIILEEWDLTAWLGIAVLSIFFGTWGDLVESMLKRNTQIKDSGSLLPGHGGILDRFDAYYFVVPFVAAWIYLYHAN